MALGELRAAGGVAGRRRAHTESSWCCCEQTRLHSGPPSDYFTTLLPHCMKLAVVYGHSAAVASLSECFLVLQFWIADSLYCYVLILCFSAFAV